MKALLFAALSFGLGVLVYDVAAGAPGNTLSPAQEAFVQGQLETVYGPITAMDVHKRATTASVAWLEAKLKPQHLTLFLLVEKLSPQRWCILSGYEDDGRLEIVPALVGPLGECA